MIARFFTCELLDIKKDSFTRAAQVDFKLPVALPIGIGLGKKRGATTFGYQKENWVPCVYGIVGEIDARGQAF